MSEIQQIVNRIMSDGNFRSALVANPFDAFQQAGVEASSAMLISFEVLEKPIVDDLNTEYKACC